MNVMKCIKKQNCWFIWSKSQKLKISKSEIESLPFSFLQALSSKPLNHSWSKVSTPTSSLKVSNMSLIFLLKSSRNIWPFQSRSLTENLWLNAPTHHWAQKSSVHTASFSQNLQSTQPWKSLTLPETATNFDSKDIRIVKKLGGTIDDTELIEGLVFDKV